MARRTFKNWFEAYKKMLIEKNIETEQSVKTLDEDAFKEAYFYDGLTIEEAYQEEMYYSAQN